MVFHLILYRPCCVCVELSSIVAVSVFQLIFGMCACMCVKQKSQHNTFFSFSQRCMNFQSLPCSDTVSTNEKIYQTETGWIRLCNVKLCFGRLSFVVTIKDNSFWAQITYKYNDSFFNVFVVCYCCRCSKFQLSNWTKKSRHSHTAMDSEQKKRMHWKLP